jgi:hypothetical protein
VDSVTGAVAWRFADVNADDGPSLISATDEGGALLGSVNWDANIPVTTFTEVDYQGQVVGTQMLRGDFVSGATVRLSNPGRLYIQDWNTGAIRAMALSLPGGAGHVYNTTAGNGANDKAVSQRVCEVMVWCRPPDGSAAIAEGWTYALINHCEAYLWDENGIVHYLHGGPGDKLGHLNGDTPWFPSFSDYLAAQHDRGTHYQGAGELLVDGVNVRRPTGSLVYWYGGWQSPDACSVVSELNTAADYDIQYRAGTRPYRATVGPNSNTWIIDIFSQVGISLPFNTIGLNIGGFVRERRWGWY